MTRCRRTCRAATRGAATCPSPAGFDLLLRDCANVCGWFRARGLEVDDQRLFGELLAQAF